MKSKLMILGLVCGSAIALENASADNSDYKDHGYKKRFTPLFQITQDGFKKSGFSRIRRSNDGMCLTINAKNLEVGAYTSWLAIFNNPSACANPAPNVDAECGAPDVGNLDTNTTMMWATAAIVGPNTKSHINFCYDLGQLSHQVLPVGTQQGLIDSKTAEVHVILRYHGPAKFDDASLLGSQLNDFNGGCAQLDMGIEGFECIETHFAVHKSH